MIAHTYDGQARASYAYYSHAPVARTEELDETGEQRIADYDADGRLIGVETLFGCGHDRCDVRASHTLFFRFGAGL